MSFLCTRIVAIVVSTAALLSQSAYAADVLFDQGHGQRFLIENSGELHLSEIATRFRDRGLEVKSTALPLSKQALAATKVLIISGPFAAHTEEEIRAILGFVERGGSLAIMLHVGPTAGRLLKRLQVAVSSGVLRQHENLIGGKTADFRVTRLAPHALTRNLDGFSVYGSWALTNRTSAVSVLAVTTRQAWIDRNRNKARDPDENPQAYAVAVTGRRGRGRFAVFGDDALFQNRYLVAENLKLCENLISWLTRSRSGELTASIFTP